MSCFLNLFAHPENSERLSIIFLIIFNRNKHFGNDFLFVSFHCPQFFYYPHALPLLRRPRLNLTLLGVLSLD